MANDVRERLADDGGCCAHLTVNWTTEELPSGFTRGWWECQTCQTHFWPKQERGYGVLPCGCIVGLVDDVFAIKSVCPNHVAQERSVFVSMEGETPGWCKNCGRHRSLHRSGDQRDQGKPEYCDTFYEPPQVGIDPAVGKDWTAYTEVEMPKASEGCGCRVTTGPAHGGPLQAIGIHLDDSQCKYDAGVEAIRRQRKLQDWLHSERVQGYIQGLQDAIKALGAEVDNG